MVCIRRPYKNTVLKKIPLWLCAFVKKNSILKTPTNPKNK